MKKLLIGVLLFSFNTYAFSKSSESNGFRNIKWQESFSKYESVMHLTSEKGNAKKFYVKENDKMYFGKTTLSSITYIFYNGKFSSVVFLTDKSVTNLTQVLIELKKKFGKPFYANKYINKYLWENANTKVSLKCYLSSHKCSIKYDSIIMSNLEKKQ